MAQEGAPFAPHGVPGGANPKGLEDPAAAQEQYSAPGGKLTQNKVLMPPETYYFTDNLKRVIQRSNRNFLVISMFKVKIFGN